jgi:FkbM family methyltransferase
VCMCACVCARARACVHVCMYACVYVHARATHAHTHTRTHIHPSRAQNRSSEKNAHRWSSVPSTPIDTLAMPRIDLIKIDAQGMEAEVLEGGRCENTF